MIAEAIVSLGIITLGVRIGFGPAIIVFFITIVLALYALPKIQLPTIAIPKVTFRIRKPQVRTVHAETHNSTALA
jgi:hypothetical protein